MSPNYPAGEDVVITFKSDVELNALTVAKYIPENVDPMLADHALALAGNSEYSEFISLSREASLTHEGDMYTFSIPGEFIEDGYEYKIGIETHPAVIAVFHICLVAWKTCRYDRKYAGPNKNCTCNISLIHSDIMIAW
ncbi:MAG: hypothetical protein K6A80_05440 [Saccharofermentans sp.]|nr:hypothetical protein [Saccharofermentans sp.]